MNQKQLLQILKDKGWELRRAKTGTHMHFTKPGHKQIVTIKDRRPTDVIPKGAMSGIRRRLEQLSVIQSQQQF